MRGLSEIQILFQEATSLNNYGPSMSQLEALALATNDQGKFFDLVYVIDRRLNDDGKHWRHVFKTLVVLEYCIVCGSELVVDYAARILPAIRTLGSFQYITSSRRDQGATGRHFLGASNRSSIFPTHSSFLLFSFYPPLSLYLVRHKAKEVVALLQDEQLLAEARRQKCLPADMKTSETEPKLYHHDKNSKLKMSSRAASSDGTLFNAGFDEESALRAALEASKHDTRSLPASSSLLEMGDGEFASALGYGNRNPFEQQAHEQALQNPFGSKDEGEQRPVDQATLANEKDPFEGIEDTLLLSVDGSKSEEGVFIPKPMEPGYAPISDAQTGAKPVQPFTSAPQFSHQNNLEEQGKGQ